MKRRRRAAAGRGKRPAPGTGASGRDGAKDPRVERAKNMAALLWTAFPLAAFLILAGAADRAGFDPSATDYGKNWPGDVQRTLIQAAIGTVVLALILRPRSFRDSADRLILALGLFVPWTAFNLLTSTHTGEVVGAHLFWLLMVCASLAYGLVKVTAARRNQPSSSPRPYG
ncbi:MAG TPA: hypothetical protein VEQ60_02225 [Longimicrobium sp.]|nr:hypothetical protein [Longimicrobium sp.]